MVVVDFVWLVKELERRLFGIINVKLFVGEIHVTLKSNLKLL